MRFVTRFLVLVVAMLAVAPAQASPITAVRRTVAEQTPVSPTLSVYPNPGHGQLSLQLAAPHGQDYKFRLNNVLGREVRLLALRPELAVEGVPLDVSNLPAGLYFYSLLINDKVVSTNRLTLQ